MARLLIATLGSLGDVHPLMDVGTALAGQGHEVRFAAQAVHEDRCESRGLQFRAIGDNEEYVSAISYRNCKLDEFDDSIAIFDRLNFRHLPQVFDELYAASANAQAIVAPMHVVAAHLVAEKRGIPLISCILSPAMFTQAFKGGGDMAPRWNIALAELRRSRGLEARAIPLASLGTGAATMLGLFPDFMLDGAIHKDIEVIGYPQITDPATDPALRAFCDERTVVFSFGSYMDACDPAHFFEESVAACRELGLKCVYLSRYLEKETAASADVLVRAFVPHDAVFPYAGAIVHHGGAGTLFAACKYTIPMVVVPFLHDQPYNAARMQALIGAPVIPAREYTRAALVTALRHVAANREGMRGNLAQLMTGQRTAADGAARAIVASLA